MSANGGGEKSHGPWQLRASDCASLIPRTSIFQILNKLVPLPFIGGVSKEPL